MQLDQIAPPFKQSEHLQLLYLVSEMLRQVEADGLNIEVILPRILRLAVEQLAAQTGSIIIADAQNGIDYSWNVDEGEEYRPNFVPFVSEVMRYGIAAIATRTQRPVRIDNTQTDARWLLRPGHSTTREPWSAICAPLVARQRSIGAITITRAGIAQFDDADSDLLNALAAQAAIHIENARLYTTTQRQLREAELFNDASRAINSSLNVNEIMQSMLMQMNELLNAEAISVALVEGDDLVYTVADGAGKDQIVGLRVPRSQGVSGWVMARGEPKLANPGDGDSFAPDGDRRTGLKTHAMICAPLQANERVLGTIQAINPPSGNFNQDDLRVLVRLATLASSAIAKSEQYMLTQAAEARYLSLFEDSIDPIVLTNHDGVIREVNRRMVEFLGRERAALIGAPIGSLHDHDILRDLAPDVWAGDSVCVIRSEVPTAQGNVPVDIHVKRAFGPTHDTLQWIYRDISQQVELEQMRNDLTAMLFHDLQNPLSNVISSLELLEMELPPDIDPMVALMASVAFRSSQRLRHLIRSLLDINQLEAGHPVHEKSLTTVAEMFAYVAEMLEVPLESRGVTLVQQIAPDVPVLHVNSDMIERVIINLADNALKFSHRDDRLTLEATLTDGDMVQIAFNDQGPGIPAAYRPAIFDKFYRTPDNTTKGIGLGLAFCRLAVEAHGGQIWVEEAAGGGARFVFTLPVTPPPPARLPTRR